MNEWGPGLATILGIVEGLTEFLPVSSTGHLILVGHALGFDGELAASAEISIQLGAILAVIAYERHKLVSMIGQAGREQQGVFAMIRTRGTTPWSTVLRYFLGHSPESLVSHRTRACILTSGRDRVLHS